MFHPIPRGVRGKNSKRLGFGICDLGFRLGFRISDLEFLILNPLTH